MAQEYPDWPLADACTEATDYLVLVAGVLDTLKVNKTLMLERARANWTTASNLADAIVRFGGFSFRSAHGIVGRTVRAAGEAGIGPDGVDAAFLDRVAQQVAGRAAGLSDAQIRAALDPEGFVATRVTAGGVQADEVRAMLAESGQQLLDDTAWHAARCRQVDDARCQLEAEVARRLQASPKAQA